MVAVIDAHEGAGASAGWEKHRLTLTLEKSKAWLAWAEYDGKWFEQLYFADFIEDRASDINSPTPTHMLELAQHFQAARSVNFESSERMSDGQTNLVYKEETTAKAGAKGTIEIPDKLRLIIKPYIGGPTYWLWARFRYRLVGGAVKLGYVLERPTELLEAAFVDIVAEIRDGKPETAHVPATDEKPSVLASPGHPGIRQPIFYGKP